MFHKMKSHSKHLKFLLSSTVFFIILYIFFWLIYLLINFKNYTKYYDYVLFLQLIHTGTGKVSVLLFMFTSRKSFIVSISPNPKRSTALPMLLHCMYMFYIENDFHTICSDHGFPNLSKILPTYIECHTLSYFLSLQNNR